MPAPRWTRASLLLPLLAALAACGDGDTPTDVAPDTTRTPPAPAVLPTLGLGAVPNRFTSELAVRGNWAYTGTWGNRGASRTAGNTLYVWNVSGAAPALRDTLQISGATTLGDVQISDDGSLLVVATERLNGSIRIFSLADPAAPRLVGTFSTENTHNGVHTAKLARVNGRLHAFLSVDPMPARLLIVDLSDPASPREVSAREMGDPFIHDVFVRDGILFTALWNGGTVMWDIGGGGQGGTVSAPVRMATLTTQGGEVHNVWWAGRDSRVISSRYVFVGQEGPSTFGTSSRGDVHVVDIGNPAAPREVAFFHVPDATVNGRTVSFGTHNFSVDERSGVLYAAYYNGGVRALDVRGDLGACTDAQREFAGGRCDLGKMGREVGRGLAGGTPAVYVWGVQWLDGLLYASDMLNGLWKLDASTLDRR